MSEVVRETARDARRDAPAPVLRLEGVGFAYPGAPAPALDGVTLEMAAGEGVALLGPNGAGKTTLTRLAMALLHPARGTVTVAGRATRGRAPEDLADVAGYLFQQPEAQLFERTVRAEVAFGPRRLGWDEARVAARVDAVLAALDLAPSADVHPYDLPVPRRRLVALAAALAAEPRLLLLDEPTAGLDRVGRGLVERAVRAVRASGVAVLAVTHDPGFAVEALERGVLLAHGRIVRDAPLDAVLGSDPAALPLPPAAEVARRLGLASASLRLADVARELAERCRAADARDKFPSS
ncbi:MAG TPA: ABC transporter ATP-binding protein [Gemmatimonadales bacterium]|nr:ABC transporter ATP-binding protein [Gemmatimonadales bacterium]